MTLAPERLRNRPGHEWPGREWPGPEIVHFNVPELGEAQRIGCEIFDPHSLKVMAADERFCFECQHNRMTASFSASRMQFGAAVDIQTSDFSDCILIHVPLSGRNEVYNGGGHAAGSPQLYTVSDTARPLTQLRTADCDMVSLRLHKRRIREYLETALGRPVRQAPRFQIEMPSAGPAGTSLTHVVRLILDACRTCAQGPQAGLLADSVERMLLAILLDFQPNDYDEALRHGAPPLAPGFVKKAEAYMTEHAHEAFTVEDLAAHVGVCSRSLFLGFRKYRDVSPMEFLRSIRLARVREELLRGGDSRALVTEIAARWGFLHHGNFTAEYKRRFGELPSHTLRFRGNRH